MSIVIRPESIVTNGVLAPIAMAPLPPVESLQTEWVCDQPDIAGSQIIILIPYEANVFDAVPGVIIRDFDYRSRSDIDGRRGYVNRLWSSNDDRSERHPPIGANHTACEKHKAACRNYQEARA